MWFDDIRQWTMLNDYGEVKRSAEDRVTWRAITRQPLNLLPKKMTQDDEL